MAKNNDKRAERMARSNRNVNRAITVLMAGGIAEFYLFYFIQVSQVRGVQGVVTIVIEELRQQSFGVVLCNKAYVLTPYLL